MMQPVMQLFDITLTSAGKARLICQLFAKYRSADHAMSLRNLS